MVNRLVTEAGPISEVAPDFPLPMGELAPLRVAAEQVGICDFTPLWAGQAAALSQEIGAEALMQLLLNETIECSKRVENSEPLLRRNPAH